MIFFPFRLLLVYKYSHLCILKDKDLPLTVLSQQESVRSVNLRIITESHCSCMDSIRSTVDQSDEGSGRTTATASISGSDGTTSSLYDESVETVPLQAQSGQTGNGTFLLSKGALPLNPNQLSADQLCENTESRTTDNKDKEDMENKVHAYMAQHNNQES